MSIRDYFNPEEINSFEDFMARFVVDEDLGEIYGIDAKFMLFSQTEQWGLYFNPMRTPPYRADGMEKVMTGDCTFCKFDDEQSCIDMIAKVVPLVIGNGLVFKAFREPPFCVGMP